MVALNKKEECERELDENTRLVCKECARSQTRNIQRRNLSSSSVGMLSVRSWRLSPTILNTCGFR